MQGYKYMPLRNLEKVKAASDRLKQVIIEKQDFEKLITRFDTPNTFFYLDPPYYTKEHLYDREDANAFSKHEELAAILKQIKGKFLLSYNNDPYIRTLYQGFTIDEVEAQYTVSGAFQTETELLIRNYWFWMLFLRLPFTYLCINDLNKYDITLQIEISETSNV